jgi:hypothetical protein
VYQQDHGMAPLLSLVRSLGRCLPALLWLAMSCTVRAVAAAEPLPQRVEFNRDIRPILSDTCFKCHGPDKAKRKAGLHFDTEEGAFADLGGHRAIVPGDPGKSELVRRITAAEDEERMPPVRSGLKLSARQIDLLRRWVAQGAKWQKHWSLIPPRRPPMPAVKNPAWVRNPIDAFILERLEREGLTPSPEADRTMLIRRVTLDLTGLPPTPAEVDAFLADHSADAYEKVVDRLLASPRYGERMAVRWLDGARYADSNGYQSDGERFMWRWRDWVIDGLNRNLPFDQFTIEQLAGDMLPGATLEQKIASGFNRNHRGNGEGGIIPEEYAVEYVVDRVETTATVWLGLTMGCARCHDHKYDPIKQKEFYQVFAYFNNVPEKGRAIKYGNSPPMIQAPTPAQQAHLAELERKLTAAESHFEKLGPQLAAVQAEWEKTLPSTPPLQWSIANGLVAHYELDGDTINQSVPSRSGKFQDGTAAYVNGRVGKAGDFDGKRFVDAGDVADFGFYDKFTCAALIYPRGPQGGAVVSRMTDASRADGYNLYLEGGKLQVNLVKRWLDDALRVETERSLAPDQWYHVMATYDGSREASGVKVYVNGRLEKLKVNLDELNQTFQTKEPLRIGAGGGPASRFHGSIGDVRVYNRVLSADEAEVLATADAITAIAAIPPGKRSPAQAHKLRAYFLEKHAPPAIQQARQQLIALRRQKEHLIESFPTTMVMEEMPTPRDTFVLIRGQYDKHGEKIAPGVPASLPPLPQSVPNNRLGFARWVVDPSNPLTVRVAVNRYWQMYFGTGLVKTVDDFGFQGEWPTHPELLDWLATEFVRTGWDIKAIQKLIVMSATYRQASKVTPLLLQKDPENRLLARGPRLRLSAEMIRDQALAVSGLLAERVGGPSVKPYQPAALWKELADMDYTPDKGANLYRRSLYTFWKRTVAPPSMMTFDAAGRETCIVRESRTNTPLQALTLMNEVTYVEAARVLAQRIMTEGGATLEERISLAFRLATARKPNPAELKILVGAFHQYLDEFRGNRKAALELVSAGEFPRNQKLDVGELAAYTAVASLILNLDETITKE